MGCVSSRQSDGVPDNNNPIFDNSQQHPQHQQQHPNNHVNIQNVHLAVDNGHLGFGPHIEHYAPPAPPLSGMSTSDRRMNTQGRRYSNMPLQQRPNRPLKRHVWTFDEMSEGRGAPSFSRLSQMRDEFWHTRVTGREEVWQTIRGVVEMLMEDGTKETLRTGREILKASDITVPAGDLRGGAYDGTGNRYDFPSYVLSNPTNMASRSSSRHSSLDSKLSMDSYTYKNSSEARRRSEIVRGKASAPRANDPGVVSAKFRLPEGYDKRIYFYPHEPLGDIGSRLMAQAGIDEVTFRIKLAQRGRVLSMTKSLPAQNWDPDSVIITCVQDLSFVTSVTSPISRSTTMSIQLPPNSTAFEEGKGKEPLLGDSLSNHPYRTGSPSATKNQSSGSISHSPTSGTAHRIPDAY